MSTRRLRSNSIVSSAQDGEDGRKNNAATATRSTSKPALTPSRNSNRGDSAQRNALRELPRIPPRPTTPLRRASSADPASGRPSARRTPAGPNSLRKPTGNTPHARAAMREIEMRRAAVLTPGRDRRRSLGRQQKETPMAAMKALSKLLAPKTKPPTPSPPAGTTEQAGPKNGKRRKIVDDFDDDDELPPRPRLSMALDDFDEDDSLILPPPTSTGLDEDNYTARSIEVPRRAASEQIGSRLSRGSFGSIRSDDRMQAFGNFDFNALVEDGMDSSFTPNDYGDDYEEDRRYSGIPREDTDTVQLDVPDEIGRRMSDFRRRALQNDETETSFMIAVPHRDDVPENMLNFGEAAEELEPLPFDAIEDTLLLADQGDAEEQDMFGGIEDDQQEEEDIEAEQDLDREQLEEGLDDEDEHADADPDQIQNPNDTIMTEDQDGVNTTALTATERQQKKKKPIKISKHGLPVPSLPAGVVKKLATTYARTSGNSKAKLNKDALAVIMQASDWFFEQVAGDLGAYSEHAGRRTIDESDVVAIMKRQRQVNATTTPFSLAQRYLPRELLQDLRMAAPAKLKKVRKLEVVREDEDEEEA